MVNIIGLNGVARSGKDTAAQGLAAHGYERFAFADPIRTSMTTLNPLMPSGRRFTQLVEDHGGDWDAVKKDAVDGTEARELMQRYGTEVGRELFGKSVWVDLLADRARRAGARNVAVSDVRFDDEAEWVRSQGGVIVQIVRPGVTAVNGHASERGLSAHLIDITVVNDGTVADLHDRVAEIAAAFSTPVLQAAA